MHVRRLAPGAFWSCAVRQLAFCRDRPITVVAATVLRDDSKVCSIGHYNSQDCTVMANIIATYGEFLAIIVADIPFQGFS